MKRTRKSVVALVLILIMIAGTVVSAFGSELTSDSTPAAEEVNVTEVPAAPAAEAEKKENPETADPSKQEAEAPAAEPSVAPVAEDKDATQDAAAVSAGQEKKDMTAATADEKKEDAAAESKADASAVKKSDAAKEKDAAEKDKDADKKKEEKKDKENKEEKEEKEKDKPVEYPAMTLTANAGGVTVTLRAPEGSLPEGTMLVARRVSGRYISAVENKLETLGRALSDAVAIDVTPIDPSGKSIQPKKSVSVSFSGTGLDLESGDTIDVFRVSDDASSIVNVGGSGSANQQTFITSHFTIYVAGGSERDPNGDRTNRPNSQSHRYVLDYGASMQLHTSHSRDSADYWSVYAGANYVSLDKQTRTITNTNETATDQNGTIRWQRSGTTEYYYITLKAKKNCVVKFYLQGAGESGFSVKDTQTILAGGDATAPADVPAEMTYQGKTYVFSGWCSDEACTEPAVLTGITANTDVYGKYTVKQHNVEFMLKDAGKSGFEKVEEGPVADGDKATAPDEPAEKTHEGKTYVFSGWCSDEACTEPAELNDIRSDKVFYAQYTLKKYTVKFHFKDAGEIAFDVIEEIEAGSGSNVTRQAPAKDLQKPYLSKTYRFSGWCSDQACSEPADMTDIQADSDFYARYAPVVKLTYDGNSGTDHSDVPGVVERPAGTKVTLGSASRESKHFASWNTKPGGDGDGYAPGAEYTMPEEDITLYAQWSDTTVNVTYYYNYEGAPSGGVFKGPFSVASNNKHYKILAEFPNREGYVFEGWATTPMGSEEYGPNEYCEVAEENFGLFAKWGKVSAQDLEVNELIAHNATVVYDGTEHKVSGIEPTGVYHWDKYLDKGYVRVGNLAGSGNYHHVYAYVGINGEGISASRTDEGTSDTPQYASLYSHNSGTGDFTSLDEVIPVKDGFIKITPATLTISTDSASKVYDGSALTKDSGTFQIGDGSPQAFTSDVPIRLYADKVLRIEITGSQTSEGTSDNTYVLHWEIPTTADRKNYNIVDGTLGKLEVYYNQVKFDANASGDTVEGMPSDDSQAGATYTIPSDTPTRTHYTFDGWNTDPDGKGDSYKADDVYTFGSEREVTFYAMWTPDKQTFTYDPNGGTFDGSTAPTVKDYHYGDEAIVAEAATRDYYEFVAWTDGEGNPYRPGDHVAVMGDISVEAQWNPVKYEITYDYAGGNAPATANPATYTVEDTISIENEPTREGYEFLGWTGTGLDEPQKTVSFGPGVTGNREYVATWKLVEYTITLKLNGGTLNGSTEDVVLAYEEGKVITLPAPTRKGYTFDYWEGSRYEAGASYKVVGDHTFKAIWKKNPDEPTDKKAKKSNAKKAKTTKTAKTTAKKVTTTTAAKVVKTGDPTELLTWIVLMGAGLLILAGVVSKKRRR